MDTVQETMGRVPIKVPTSPWGNSEFGEEVEQFIGGRDQIFECLRSSASSITRDELQYGDLISWHGTQSIKFPYYFSQEYFFTQHVGASMILSPSAAQQIVHALSSVSSKSSRSEFAQNSVEIINQKILVELVSLWMFSEDKKSQLFKRVLGILENI